MARRSKGDDEEKPLRISKRAARHEALASAAALIKAHDFTMYDGQRISESDDLTCDAWKKIDLERQRIAHRLALLAGIPLKDLHWEST